MVVLLALTSPAIAATQAEFVTVPSQPANAGDAKIAALKYHDSGEYERDLQTIGTKAEEWLTRQAGATQRPAVVLDVDETALSNWEVIQRDDFGRPVKGPCVAASDAPCGWAAWDLLGRDPAIASTLHLFRHARTNNVTVFFITGRPESQRAASERNLAAAGYSGYKKLYLVPDGAHFDSAAQFKSSIRSDIEQAGYSIVANVGDQPSDLEGGHAMKCFLLPNPFYRVP